MKYSDTTQAVDTRNLEISCVNVTWKAHIFTDNTYIPQAAFPDLLEGPEMRDMICHHTMDHMHFVDNTHAPPAASPDSLEGPETSHLRARGSALCGRNRH